MAFTSLRVGKPRTRLLPWPVHARRVAQAGHAARVPPCILRPASAPCSTAPRLGTPVVPPCYPTSPRLSHRLRSSFSFWKGFFTATAQCRSGATVILSSSAASASPPASADPGSGPRPTRRLCGRPPVESGAPGPPSACRAGGPPRRRPIIGPRGKFTTGAEDASGSPRKRPVAICSPQPILPGGTPCGISDRFCSWGVRGVNERYTRSRTGTSSPTLGPFGTTGVSTKRNEPLTSSTFHIHSRSPGFMNEAFILPCRRAWL